jgi:hypothetical protein
VAASTHVAASEASSTAAATSSTSAPAAPCQNNVGLPWPEQY